MAASQSALQGPAGRGRGGLALRTEPNVPSSPFTARPPTDHRLSTSGNTIERTAMVSEGSKLEAGGTEQGVFCEQRRGHQAVAVIRGCANVRTHSETARCEHDPARHAYLRVSGSEYLTRAVAELPGSG